MSEEKRWEVRKTILKAIEKNSRIELKELAMSLDINEVDVANEMAAMEKEKIICGYHTMIDWEKTGVEKVTALIEVKATPERDEGFTRIAERIYRFPEVDSVYLISGNYDLLVTMGGKTLREISSFVNETLAPIDGVTSTATFFILHKYKEHGSIFSTESSGGRMLVTP